MFLNRKGSFNNGKQIVFLTSKLGGYKRFFNDEEREIPEIGGERIAFGNFAKGQKMYGSMTRRRKRDHEVEYDVKSGDTLQGIAIKFGITTGDIRRANHLWTNDSLFLRDKLLIPNNVAEIQHNSSNINHFMEKPKIKNMDFKLTKIKGSSLLLFDDTNSNEENVGDFEHPLDNVDLNAPHNSYDSTWDTSFIQKESEQTNGAKIQTHLQAGNGKWKITQPTHLNPSKSTSNSYELREKEIDSEILIDKLELTPEEFLSRTDRVIASSFRKKKTIHENNAFTM